MMPLHTNPPRVEIYVFNLGQHDDQKLTGHGRKQMLASYQEYLRRIHIGLVFAGSSDLQRQAVKLFRKDISNRIPIPLLSKLLDPLWVDREDDLPGINLKNELETLRITTSQQTLDNVLKYARRAMVLRGYFPGLLIRIADGETARSVRGRIQYAILIITESPLAEMAWPGSMVHQDLLRPADIVHYTLMQGETCRDWTIQPNPKILRCPLDSQKGA
ncbi:MAG: hypothetical protein V1695_03150 [Candidatus Uhrbacteria bacterium]